MQVSNLGAELSTQIAEQLLDTFRESVPYGPLDDRVAGSSSLQKTKSSVTFTLTNYNCLLSHRLRILKAERRLHLFFYRTRLHPTLFMPKALHALNARWKKWTSTLTSNIPRTYTAGFCHSELRRDNSLFVSPRKGSLCIY